MASITGPASRTATRTRVGRVQPLAPIRAAMRAMAAHPDVPPLVGLAPKLTVYHKAGWVSASRLVSGEALTDLVNVAATHWRASPHVAASLAWRRYVYWLALPAVVGFAAAGRVPLLRPDRVVLRWSTAHPLVTVGLTNVEVAVLADDPVASPSDRAHRVRVLADEDALLAELRSTLMEAHLTPIMQQLHERWQLGRRTLWGSLASGVAHGLSRAATVSPHTGLPTVSRVLAALDLDRLVDVWLPLDGPSGNGGPVAVRRRTCCLAFKLPTPKICRDCCLR